MAMRADGPVGMLAVESHVKVSDLLVVCAFSAVGIAAALGATLATDLAAVLAQVVG